VKHGIQEFIECIASRNLIDMGFSDPKFTWCDNQQGKESMGKAG